MFTTSRRVNKYTRLQRIKCKHFLFRVIKYNMNMSNHCCCVSNCQYSIENSGCTFDRFRCSNSRVKQCHKWVLQYKR